MTRIELALQPWQGRVIPFHHIGAHGFLIIFLEARSRDATSHLRISQPIWTLGEGRAGSERSPPLSIRTLATDFILFCNPSIRKVVPLRIELRYLVFHTSALPSLPKNLMDSSVMSRTDNSSHLVGIRT